MADQKMYLPPHRRQPSTSFSHSLSISRPSTPSLILSPILIPPSPSPSSASLKGTIPGPRHLPLLPPTTDSVAGSNSRSATLIESQSVQRGYGRFGASESSASIPPSWAPSQTTQGRSVVAQISETELDEEEGKGEEDLNDASATYSLSTNLARSTSDSIPTPIRPHTHTHTPLPTHKWNSVTLTTAPLPPKPPPTLLLSIPSSDILPPKPRPLLERISRDRPLIERVGQLYIPPNARGYRDDLGVWQYPPQSCLGNDQRGKAVYEVRDDDDFWNSQKPGRLRKDEAESRASWWQSELVRRQRLNISKQSQQSPSHPGPSRRNLQQPTFSQVAVLYYTLGEKLVSLRLEDLAVTIGESIEEVQLVGSYKWIESESGPTLAVPAVPDIWDPPKVVGKLKHDKDIENYEEFSDYASALLPPSLSTLEPLFLSLTSPDVLYDVDLVTGRNNLRKLWSACGAGDNYHTSPWRIDIEYINCGDSPGMVILERYEPPETHRSRQIPNGYRQSYQEATTRKVLDGSDRTPGCNRTIKYSFGGLKMMVKFDTPAFIPSESRSGWTKYRAGDSDLFDTTTNDGVSTMDGLDFDDPVYNGQSIRIRHTNLTPPTQGDCLSIKTKHHQDTFDAEYHYPQMYFSQTPRVIYAKHQHGDFRFPIEEYDLFLDPVPICVKEDRQNTLDRVAALLRWIVGLAKKYKHGLGLVWDGKEFGVCQREKKGGKELSGPVREMIMDVRGRDRSVIASSLAGLSIAGDS